MIFSYLRAILYLQHVLPLFSAGMILPIWTGLSHHLAAALESTDVEIEEEVRAVIVSN